MVDASEVELDAGWSLSNAQGWELSLVGVEGKVVLKKGEASVLSLFPFGGKLEGG